MDDTLSRRDLLKGAAAAGAG
ncbi:MAG: twin-arginine translocation signal domain-containing protein, partial [Terriglobales bacterium]